MTPVVTTGHKQFRVYPTMREVEYAQRIINKIIDENSEQMIDNQGKPIKHPRSFPFIGGLVRLPFMIA